MNQVDTISIPELLICKAAGLTRQIRMGPAVKIIHLQHPVDVATLAAVTDHVTNGRYIFGFGSGFANAYFSEERGLSFDDRHERMMESLELILTETPAHLRKRKDAETGLALIDLDLT